MLRLHNLSCIKAERSHQSQWEDLINIQCNNTTLCFQVLLIPAIHFCFSLGACFALDKGFPKLIICQGFLNPLFFLWLLVYNKKPSTFILDFGFQQSLEMLLLELIVTDTEVDGWENVEESSSGCQSFSAHRGANTWFGSFFFTHGHVGICCEPSGLNPVLISGMCMLRRLSPLGFPDDSKFPFLCTGVRKDQKPYEQGTAMAGEEGSDSSDRENMIRQMLFLMNSWFLLSVQILLKKFEMHELLLRRSLQTGKVTSQMSWRGAQRIFLPCPARCLRMQS